MKTLFEYSTELLVQTNNYNQVRATKKYKEKQNKYMQNRLNNKNKRKKIKTFVYF